MAVDPFLARITLPKASGVSRDAVQNSVAILFANTASNTDMDNATVEIAKLYNDTTTGQSVAGNMSDELSRASNAVRVDWYHLLGHEDGSPHGSPVHTSLFTLANFTASQSYPSEVALCVTLLALGRASQPAEGPIDPSMPVPKSAQHYGAPSTFSGQTRPKQRYTGRMYLGPWNTDAGTEFVGPGLYSVPTTGLVNAITSGVKVMTHGLLGISNPASLCVWSRRNAQLISVDQTVGAQIAFVDNEWDTARRRRVAATTRTFATF